MRFPMNILARLKLSRTDPPRVVRVAPEPGVHFFGKLVRNTAPQPLKTRPAPDVLAVLQYTGGTTGGSKGAMLTQRNVGANLQQTGAWLTGTKRGHDVTLTARPPYRS